VSRFEPVPARESRRLLTDHVRDELLKAIHAGELQTGDKVPNEQQLCELFGVSRVTIREAVRSLVEAGYLDRIQGSGTYIAFRPRARHSLERNLSYTSLIEEAGMRFGRRMLTIERGAASSAEAERLGMEHNAEVVRVERVRYADDRPAIYSIDTLPAALVPGISDEAFGSSLYHLLGDLGHRVTTGEATLRPVLAEPPCNKILEIGVGSALLHIRQTDLTAAGMPVMFSLEWHVPGIFELTLLRRAL